jgi:hypothetical protein
MRDQLMLPVPFMILLLLSISLSLGAVSPVSYPEEYRNWTRVKSMVIQQGHPLWGAFGGIHHIYANKKALDAMRQGKEHPDGSVLVFDLLNTRFESNAIVEGPRKVLGVMEKDSRKYASTGGWGFEGFKGDTKERAVTDPENDCFSCHAHQKENDYVFSDYRK